MEIGQVQGIETYFESPPARRFHKHIHFKPVFVLNQFIDLEFETVAAFAQVPAPREARHLEVLPEIHGKRVTILIV